MASENPKIYHPIISKEYYDRMEEEFDDCKDTCTVLKENGVPALIKTRWHR